MMMPTAWFSLKAGFVRIESFQQIFAILHYYCLFCVAGRYNYVAVRPLSVPQNRIARIAQDQSLRTWFVAGVVTGEIRSIEHIVGHAYRDGLFNIRRPWVYTHYRGKHI